MSDSSGNLSDEPGGAQRPARDYTVLLLVIPVLVVLVLVTLGIVPDRGQPAGSNSGGLAAGETAPEIRASGWLNGEPPDLKGRVVVLDVWASWCGPCRQKAPELVELHEKFHDRGVVFVGLSVEDGEALRRMQQFVDECRITWPNGYGAEQTIEQLRIEFIPRVWVIGADGKVVWSDESGGHPAEAIERALAALAH